MTAAIAQACQAIVPPATIAGMDGSAQAELAAIRCVRRIKAALPHGNVSSRSQRFAANAGVDSFEVLFRRCDGPTREEHQ
jgi:hypothetical protein